MPDPLAALGLTAAAQAAYELLVDRTSATEDELADAWIRTADLTAVLLELEERGLVTVVPGAPIRYRAVAPGIAFQSLLYDHAERLDAARRQMATLETAYRDNRSVRDPSSVVEVAAGDRAVRQRLAQIGRWTRQQVRRLEKAPWPGDADPLHAAAPAAGGPAVRTIYDRSTLEHPGALPAVEALIRSGQQTRVLPELPLSLYLADDRLAVLPREIAGRPAVAIVHPSALLDGLIRLFEELWQRALPLGQADAPPVVRRDPSTGPAGQQRLVMLLLSGLTDEAIARQLSVGYRSAQRRVAALMAELDAHTRFQAGVQAALRGYPGD
ncbi:MAG TPA: helix-turn-helix domain-containing protein [Micromonosporaceae bacterium]